LNSNIGKAARLQFLS